MSLLGEGLVRNGRADVHAARMAWPSPWMVGLLGLITLCGVAQVVGRHALPDVAWPIYLAQRWFGQPVPVEVVEVNPPLLVWLAGVPVALSRILPLTPWQLVLVLTTGLALVSGWAASRLLAGMPGMAAERHRMLLVAAAIFALLVLPRRDFSEREHLALILTLPWTLMAGLRFADREPERWLRVPTGVAAAVGFAFKPHFLIVWLLIETAIARRRGLRGLLRAENMALMATGGAYFLAIVAFDPGYFGLAASLAPLYSSYLDNGIALTVLLGIGGPLPMFALLAWAGHRHASGARDPLLAVLGLATMGFLVAAVLQQKGWRYHYVAAMGYGLILLAAIALAPLRPAHLRPSVLVSRLAGPVLILVSLITVGAALREPLVRKGPRWPEEVTLPLLVPVVRSLASGEPVLVMSINPASAWPLITEAGVPWASRYMSQWMLAGLYHEQLWDFDRWRRAEGIDFTPVSERTGHEREFHEAVIHDLERHRPRLILVLEIDQRIWGWGGATRLDYLGYFMPDPRFRTVLSEYRDAGLVGGYRILRREGAGPAAP